MSALEKAKEVLKDELEDIITDHKGYNAVSGEIEQKVNTTMDAVDQVFSAIMATQLSDDAYLVALEVSNRTLRFSNDYLLSKIEATEENKKKLNDANAMDIQSFADAQVAKERERAEGLVKALEYITCLDINPALTSLSAQKRIQLAAKKADKVLAKYQEKGE
jgi:hypothetical protein